MEAVTIGPCRIYNADCLTVLASMADDSVDCVVTSPPYNTLPATHSPSGLHAERQQGVNKWIEKAANGYEDQQDEGEYQEWLQTVVSECLRVSRGLVWVNHKVRYRDGEAIHPARFLPFPIWSEVVWDRGGSMALNCKKYAPSHEGLWAFGRPHYWDDSLNTKMSVWRISPRRSDDHPCPYPFEIARRPIVSSCPEGGTVFDPFTGSGTTGVVCVREGRNFIGTEKDRRFFAIATRDIRDAVLGEKSSLFPALGGSA